MRGKAKDRARPSRARTWSLPGTARPAGVDAVAGPRDILSAFLRAVGTRLHDWIARDVAPGRLVPWLPVAFGTGVALYFTADSEPMLLAGIIASSAALALCFALRARPLAWPVSLGIAALLLGFTFATWKTARIAHPVLAAPAYNVTLSGFVEAREERERSDRFMLRVHAMSGARTDIKLERVRLSVRKGTAPPVASFVELRARLTPPLPPLRPGGYDFARDHYFQRLGAGGFVLGAVRQAAPPHPPDLRLRYAATIGALRDALDARIRTVLKGDQGAIASALITGKRDTISASVNEAMYVSSLAHVLSISGYHMALVAGVVFFVIRAGLALFPAVANRHPIKKWGLNIDLIDKFVFLLPICYLW